MEGHQRRTVRALVLVIIAGIALLASDARATRPRAVSLMQDHKCYICHGERDAKAGPSFAEIAARYRDQPDALAVVSLRVTRGAHGELWNMPPHPEVTRAEARVMARYILSRR